MVIVINNGRYLVQTPFNLSDHSDSQCRPCASGDIDKLGSHGPEANDLLRVQLKTCVLAPGPRPVDLFSVESF